MGGRCARTAPGAGRGRLSLPRPLRPPGAAGRRAPELLLCVERRVCFTLEDLAPAAPAFDYLCACVGGRRPPGAAAAPGAAGFRLGAGAAEAAVAGPGGSGHTAGVSGSALSQHASDGAACAPGGRGESVDGARSEGASCAAAQTPEAPGGWEAGPGGQRGCLSMTRLDCSSVPQVLDYERGSDLELWQMGWQSAEPQ